jgi:hypothetical protein
VPAFAERVHVVEALQRVRIASKKELLFSVGFTLKSSENIKARIGKWVLGIGGTRGGGGLHTFCTLLYMSVDGYDRAELARNIDNPGKLRKHINSGSVSGRGTRPMLLARRVEKVVSYLSRGYPASTEASC